MEIKGPKPVKAYAYRMAIEEFEMYAERCIEQVLVDHRRQTRTKHPWSARSYIWPLSDTFALSRPERRIEAAKSPILPLDKFIELYKLNCERILADLEHERVCRYLEDLTSTLESLPTVHAPTEHSSPMDTSSMPMKSTSTPSRIHRRFTGHTTAEDLLESILGKLEVFPSETTTSPACSASNRQTMLACAGIKDCGKHSSNAWAVSTEHTTPCQSYTIAPPEYRRHDHGTSFTQSTGMHQVHSAILLDPAVMEAVPYDTHLVCPSDIAPSTRPPPCSRHGLTRANRCEGVGPMGSREVKAKEYMEGMTRIFSVVMSNWLVLCISWPIRHPEGTHSVCVQITDLYGSEGRAQCERDVSPCDQLKIDPGLVGQTTRGSDQFQCSPRPEDLPLPQFSLAKMKAVSKTSSSSGSDTSAS